ncbi:hypothetical protein B0H21DRAFT_894957 [Amylocystis lapponica]|nr:hypothetical protein B0H21DRAFT_894957 [Amylocystis lapponica]
MASTSRTPTTQVNYSDLIVNRVLADANAQAECAAKRRRINIRLASDYAPKRRIQDLPLEILLQISQWVRPGDLLTLIRTTKRLRKILLDRKVAALVWEVSLTCNVQDPKLPGRPTFLSEVKYAELAFGRHCFKCGRDAPAADSVFWKFRARYCKICKFQEIIPNNQDKTPSEQRRFQSLMDVCPVVQGIARVRSSAPLTTAMTVHKPDIDHLERRLAGTSQDQRTRIMEEMKKQTEEIKQFALRLRRWDHDWRETRWEETDGARELKLKRIIKHLIALGYGIDILYLGPSQKKLSELQAVHKTERWNDATWEKIRHDVIEFMDNRKASRLDWERVKQMRERLAILERSLVKALDANDLYPVPHALDLVFYRKIRAVIESPSDVDVTNMAFDGMLPGILKHWQREVTVEMSACLLKTEGRHGSDGGDDSSRNPLKLAKSILKCACGAIRTWPDAASHSHEESGGVNDCIGPDRHAPDFDGTLDPIPRTAFETAVRGRYWPRKAWSSKCFHPCDAHVAGLFRACDLDPNTTTCAQMDRLDARFSCKLCSVPEKVKYLMPWRNALLHCVQDHLGSLPSTIKWTRATHAETAAAKRLERLRGSQTAGPLEDLQVANWHCRYCYAGRLGARYTMKDAIKHVQKHHRIQNAGDSDVVQDPDNSVLVDDSVVLISEKYRHKMNRTMQKMLDTRRACFFAFG